MSIIEILKAIVFGLVEGFTEWLPISSTAHMLILDELIKLDVTPEFKVIFLTVIQVGAALALLVGLGLTDELFDNVCHGFGVLSCVLR